MRPGRLVKPMTLTPFTSTTSSGFDSGQLPPCVTARSTTTEPGRMDLHHRFGDQHRRGAAGDQRRGDDDVLLGDVAGDQFGLLSFWYSGDIGLA